jgi:hypothetical protein
MASLPGRLAARQHLVLALLTAWLFLTSPWVHLYRRIPRNAGWLDLSHVVLGVVTTLLALSFTLYCLRRAGWRVYFPWLSGELGLVGRELKGLFRGELPSADGGGLFALIEGLLLLTMLATGLSGVAWLLVQNTPEALAWRSYHILAARCTLAALVLHIIAVSLHLRDFMGE